MRNPGGHKLIELISNDCFNVSMGDLHRDNILLGM